MSLSKAINFVKLAKQDEAQRMQCYQCNSKNELHELLGFSQSEFEDAINMHLVKCQTHEDAAIIQELRFWFSML